MFQTVTAPTTKSTDRRNYLLVLLLVCISGNSSFDAVDRQEVILVTVCCLLAVLLVWLRKTIPTVTLLVIIPVFSAILAVQGVTFKFFPLVTITGVFLRLFVGYAVLRLVDEFPRLYVKILFHLSVVGLCFYVPDMICSNIGIDFRSFFEPLRRLVGVETKFNIVVYNFQKEPSAYRNAACFGEPGLFAACLLLAIMFLGLEKNKYKLKQYTKILTVLFVSLLTTFSTTGYILLPLCLLLHTDLANIRRQRIPQLLLMVAVIVSLAALFYRLDFVGTKLKGQYEEAVYREENWQSGRIGTLIYELEYISAHPIFGYGPHSKSRYILDDGESITGLGNGLSDFTCKFGLLGLTTFIVSLWKGISKLTKSDRIKPPLFVLLILLMLNGEPLLNFPLFMSLMFLNMRPVGVAPDTRYVSYQKRILTHKRNLLIRTGIT